jgi:small subunit ribosomal protein S7e
MFTARQKIKKERGAPSDLENQVAQAFVDLEINNEELRPTLKNLHIVAAREVRVNNSTAAIVVFVPYRLRELFRKNQVRLVCELEKKFSGQHVVLVAQRKIQDKEKHSNRKASKGQVRPRSRTLTAVHDAVLSDVVYPANISAKRTRYLMDGNKQIKVELENPYEVSEKLDTFSAVYAALTGKSASFSLPAQEE